MISKLLEIQAPEYATQRIQIDKIETANHKGVRIQTQTLMNSQTRLKHLTFDFIRVMDKNISFIISPVHTSMHIAKT